MTAQRIGILHPGEMGSAVAATLRNSGHEVWWVSEGRSHRTRARAESAGFKDAGTLARLCESCPVLVSVCPPEFAAALSAEVLEHRFTGTFLDANAVSPAHKKQIAGRMQARGVHFVDGGIIGLPPKARGQTWLYLSGRNAQDVAGYFDAGPLDVEVVGTEIGHASALKMCFAAQSKGSIALLIAVMAAADRLGVLEDLRRQWTRGGPVMDKTEAHVLRSAPKAWRWVPEMHEIAATFDSVGIPPEFHRAAAKIYDQLREFKDADPASIDEVLKKLRDS